MTSQECVNNQATHILKCESNVWALLTGTDFRIRKMEGFRIRNCTLILSSGATVKEYLNFEILNCGSAHAAYRIKELYLWPTNYNILLTRCAFLKPCLLWGKYTSGKRSALGVIQTVSVYMYNLHQSILHKIFQIGYSGTKLIKNPYLLRNMSRLMCQTNDRYYIR